jgi:hypothetical protein
MRRRSARAPSQPPPALRGATRNQRRGVPTLIVAPPSLSVSGGIGTDLGRPHRGDDLGIRSWTRAGSEGLIRFPRGQVARWGSSYGRGPRWSSPPVVLMWIWTRPGPWSAWGPSSRFRRAASSRRSMTCLGERMARTRLASTVAFSSRTTARMRSRTLGSVFWDRRGRPRGYRTGPRGTGSNRSNPPRRGSALGQ